MNTLETMEKWIIELILLAAGVISTFFWYIQRSQDKRITELDASVAKAHKRISDQAESNNDKFARREDIGDIKDDLANLKVKVEGVSTNIEWIRKSLEAKQ